LQGFPSIRETEPAPTIARLPAVRSRPTKVDSRCEHTSTPPTASPDARRLLPDCYQTEGCKARFPRPRAKSNDGRYWARTSDLRLVEAVEGGNERELMGMKRQEMPAKQALRYSSTCPGFPAVSRRDVRQVCAKQRLGFPSSPAPDVNRHLDVTQAIKQLRLPGPRAAHRRSTSQPLCCSRVLTRRLEQGR
jgi:hypothetical protein